MGTARGRRGGPVRGRRRGGVHGGLLGLVLLAPTTRHGRAPVVVEEPVCVERRMSIDAGREVALNQSTGFTEMSNTSNQRKVALNQSTDYLVNAVTGSRWRRL